MRVLLVEPDTMLARIYSQAFEQAGWQVLWAPSAQAAIDAADEQTPDIVVLELQLTAHSGIEFLYEFRSYPDWKHIPVIIHSLVPPAEFDDHELLQKQLGVAHYHYKLRTSITQLLATMRRQFLPEQ